jgi:uncharacterized protein YcbK (DUF882 family)
MGIPVGPTSATFLVSIAALGGCGFWWKCSQDPEVEPVHHQSRSVAIDERLHAIEAEPVHHRPGGVATQSEAISTETHAQLEDPSAVVINAISTELPSVVDAQLEVQQDSEMSAQLVHLDDSKLEDPRAAAMDNYLDAISTDATRFDFTQLDDPRAEAVDNELDADSMDMHLIEDKQVDDPRAATIEMQVYGISTDMHLVDDTELDELCAEAIGNELDAPSTDTHLIDDAKLEDPLAAASEQQFDTISTEIPLVDDIESHGPRVAAIDEQLDAAINVQLDDISAKMLIPDEQQLADQRAAATDPQSDAIPTNMHAVDDTKLEDSRSAAMSKEDIISADMPIVDDAASEDPRTAAIEKQVDAITTDTHLVYGEVDGSKLEDPRATEIAEDYVGADRHPLSTQSFGSVPGIAQSLGLAVPFGLAILCDAFLIYIVTCCLRQVKKLFFGRSEVATSTKNSPKVTDIPVAGKLVAPTFCKVKKPTLDEPLADIVEPPEIDLQLQAQINSIVQSHVEFRKQQTEWTVEAVAHEALNAAKLRQLSQSPTKYDAPWSASKDLASPSPAKSLSNIEINYLAHMSLSAAKERNTPAKTPSAFFVDASPRNIQWDAYEEVASYGQSLSQNLQSKFDDSDDEVEKEKVASMQDSVEDAVKLEQVTSLDEVEQEKVASTQDSVEDAVKHEQVTSLDEVEQEKVASMQHSVADAVKHEQVTSLQDTKDKKCKIEIIEGFDVTQIPSPCRKRSFARMQSPQANDETIKDESGTASVSSFPKEEPFILSPEVRMRQNGDVITRTTGKAFTPSRERKLANRHTPSRELANRRAKAFEAWGVASPDQYDLSYQ